MSATADVRVKRGSTWMIVAPRSFASMTKRNATGWLRRNSNLRSKCSPHSPDPEPNRRAAATERGAQTGHRRGMSNSRLVFDRYDAETSATTSPAGSSLRRRTSRRRAMRCRAYGLRASRRARARTWRRAPLRQFRDAVEGPRQRAFFIPVGVRCAILCRRPALIVDGQTEDAPSLWGTDVLR